MLGTEEPKEKKPSTRSVEAHNAYLQGHFYFERRNLKDYLQSSFGFFDQAIRLDPDYALAYAERSEAWAWIGDLSSEKKKEAWATAGRDAEKAVAVDPNLAEAHAALGWVRFFIEWKFNEGLAELRRAQQLSPWNQQPPVIYWREWWFILVNLKKPRSWPDSRLNSTPSAIKFGSAWHAFFLPKENSRRAETAARKAAELQPSAAGNHRFQVFVAIQRGDAEAALHEAELEPNERYRRFEFALAYYARGDRATADSNPRLPSWSPEIKMLWPIRWPRSMPVAVKRTRLSSGYKPPLITHDNPRDGKSSNRPASARFTA